VSRRGRSSSEGAAHARVREGDPVDDGSLVGLLELAGRLQLRHNRSLESCLALRRKFSPLTAEDTVDYLRFRLQAAGAQRDIFECDAIVYLQETTDGVLRDLDGLATVALDHATMRRSDKVDRAIIQHVAAVHAQYQQA